MKWKSVSPHKLITMTREEILEEEHDKLIKLSGRIYQSYPEKALKELQEWFTCRSKKLEYREVDFIRIWKIIFPLLNADNRSPTASTDDVAVLFMHLPLKSSFMFFHRGMTVISQLWFSLDITTARKYLLLIRKLLKYAVMALNEDFSSSFKTFNHFVSKVLLNSKKLIHGTVVLHFIDVFMEVVAEVLKPYSEGILAKIILPFVKRIATAVDHIEDDCLVDEIVVHIFHYLLQQADKDNILVTLPGWAPHSTVLVKPVNDIKPLYGIGKVSKVYCDQIGNQVEIKVPQVKFNSLTIWYWLKQHAEALGVGFRSRHILKRLTFQYKAWNHLIWPWEEDGTVKEMFQNSEFNMQRVVRRKGRRGRSYSYFQRNSGVWIVTKVGEAERADQNQLNICRSNVKKRKHSPELRALPEIKSRCSTTTDEFSKEAKRRRKSDSSISYIFPKAEWDSLQSKSPHSPKNSPAGPISNTKESLTQNNMAPEKILDMWKSNSRVFANADQMKNPFCGSSSTPTKRVKINLKMNRSQEVDEWNAQITSSPGNPHDADKRPLKSVLKTPPYSSPIEPSYYKKVFKNKLLNAL